MALVGADTCSVFLLTLMSALSLRQPSKAQPHGGEPGSYHAESISGAQCAGNAAVYLSSPLLAVDVVQGVEGLSNEAPD